MRKVKRITLLFLLVVASLSLIIGCDKGGKTSGGSAKAGGAVAQAEAYLQEELNGPLPDFTSPTIEVKMEVEGMPEDVVWLTSEPKDLSSKHAKIGGTLHYSLSEYPTTFRYTGPESNSGSRGLMWSVYSLIATNRETQEYMPLSATHWAFGADGYTVYYKLHDKLEWSDGVPCTADDFVFGWEVMCSPNLNDPWYNDYYSEMEVKKISDHCVAVKFLGDSKLASAQLLDKTNISPRPKHFFNGELKKDWYIEYNWKIEPTTAPYVMKEDENIKGELLVFERKDNWWGRSYPYLKNTANVQRIEYKVITGGADITENYFYKGELDTFFLNIPDKWRKASSQPNVQNGYIDRYVANYQPLEGMSGAFFNTKFKLFNGEKGKLVRRAMYYAFDIQGMIDQALYGEYKRKHNIGMGHVWGGVDFNDHTIRKPDFDPDKAQELLGEAGYSKMGDDGILMNPETGDRVSFEVLYPYANWTERLTVIREQAKKAGVELNLKLMESGMWNAFINKKYECAWTGYSTWYEPSYWQFFNKGHADVPSTNNVFGWWSEEMEKLLDVEQSRPPLPEKAENNKKIERLVHEEALMVPDYYLDFRRVGVWKWIRLPWWGNRKNAAGEIVDEFGYMWIDEDIKAEVLDAKANGKTYEPRVYYVSDRYVVE